MIAGNVTSSYSVHSYGALLPERVFATSAIDDASGEVPARGRTDILGQGKSRTAWGIFFETMVLLDNLYVVLISEHARSPDGHFLGWTPGKMPIQEDSRLSWRLDSGTDLVLLLHMQPTGKPEVIQSTLGIHFADQPPTKTPHIIRLGTQTIDIPAGDKHHVIRRYIDH